MPTADDRPEMTYRQFLRYVRDHGLPTAFGGGTGGASVGPVTVTGGGSNGSVTVGGGGAGGSATVRPVDLDAAARLRRILQDRTGNSFSPRGAQGSPTSEVTEATATARGGAAAGRTPGQHATGGVVDAIDAAVDGLCGCGCKTRIRPDGPSVYFASQECQSRWANSTQVDNPGEVYRGEDAHIPAPGRYLPPARRENEPRAAGPETPIPSRWWETHAGTVLAIGYRAFCLGCERFRHPEPIDDLMADVRAFTASTGPYVPGWGCRVCCEPFRFTAAIQFLPDVARLDLEYGAMKVSHLEATDHLRRVCDIRSYADRIWQQLERDMNEHNRERMRAHRRLSLGTPVIGDPAAIIRATGT